MDLEGIPAGHHEGEGILSAIPGDFVRRQILPTNSDTIGILSAAPFLLVVLRVDFNASLSIVQLGDDVAPRLVIVYTKGDDKVLAGVGDETKAAASTAAAYSEDVCRSLRPRCRY